MDRARKARVKKEGLEVEVVLIRVEEPEEEEVVEDWVETVSVEEREKLGRRELGGELE